MLDLSVWWICLALNVYHEARSETIDSQLAVALVTLNRAHYRKDLICKEVFKYKQFSWTLKSDWTPHNQKAWKRSIQIARMAFKIEDFTTGATHFHTVSVRPYWSKTAWKCDAKFKKQQMKFVHQWGTHLFYKELRL
jgi:spore germination cell wall hydrolase CwlJ-like protein